MTAETLMDALARLDDAELIGLAQVHLAAALDPDNSPALRGWYTAVTEVVRLEIVRRGGIADVAPAGTDLAAAAAALSDRERDALLTGQLLIVDEAPSPALAALTEALIGLLTYERRRRGLPA